MSTKNIQNQVMLRIPVDEMEIIKGPSKSIVQSAQSVYSAYDCDKRIGVSARFTVRTPASDCEFVVKAIMYEAHRVPSLCQCGDDEECEECRQYRFTCLIKGETFFGTYDPQVRTGVLRADYYDPHDPTDPRNHP